MLGHRTAKRLHRGIKHPSSSLTSVARCELSISLHCFFFSLSLSALLVSGSRRPPRKSSPSRPATVPCRTSASIEAVNILGPEGPSLWNPSRIGRSGPHGLALGTKTSQPEKPSSCFTGASDSHALGKLIWSRTRPRKPPDLSDKQSRTMTRDTLCALNG